MKENLFLRFVKHNFESEDCSRTVLKRMIRSQNFRATVIVIVVLSISNESVVILAEKSQNETN